MWPSTDRFRARLPHGHVVSTAIQILSDDTLLADLTPYDLVQDGSVSVSHSEIQRSGSLSLVDLTGELSPQDADDLFAPVGNQIRLWRGIDYEDGTAPELMPILTGRFTAALADFPRIELSDIYDRAWIVGGNLLEAVLTVALGSSLMDTIALLVATAYPGVPMNLPTTDEVTNAMVFDAGSNPWQLAQDFAANVGMRLFFDPMGVLQAATEPSDGDSPVLEYDDSSEDCMALPGTAASLTGVGFNGVTVIAENSNLATPLRSVAKDLDPSSPMQWGGRYGRRMAPEIRDEKIASQAQCDARARQELQNQLGLVQTITIPSMVHPGLEAMDPLRISIARTQLTGTPPIRDQFAILDSLTVPMRAKASSTITTRARRVVTIS
jgi:hypothetical protein